MAKVSSYSNLRAHLAELLDSVTNDLEPVIVRRRGKKDVVFMDAAELSSIMETWHLLKSPANAKALFEALDDVQSGKGTEMTLEEFRSKKWLPQHAEV